MPRVSIGLPIYNGERRFMSEAIESVLAQTFTDFELIICDNASTDRTPEICQQYARRDKRIKYYRNEKNIGILVNFIFFLPICIHKSVTITMDYPRRTICFKSEPK